MVIEKSAIKINKKLKAWKTWKALMRQIKMPFIELTRETSKHKVCSRQVIY